MKLCELCLFPRPIDEERCALCDSDAFSIHSDVLPKDFALRMAAENRFGVAYLALEDEIANGGESAEKCSWLAWLALMLKDQRAVEIWSHESQRLDGESPDPHLALARAFELEQRWPEALEEYQAALRRSGLHQARRGLMEQARDRVASNIPEW